MLSEIRISRSALTRNVRAFRRVIGPRVRLMAVVKSNAYGHGVGECAPILARAGANWFGVASVTEALQVRQLISKKSILVLSILDGDDRHIGRAIRANIRLPAYTLSDLARLQRVARRARMKALVHVKFDTGTTRIGFLPTDFQHVVEQLRHCPNLSIEGVYSHFAEVESARQKFSQLQHERFATLAKRLEVAVGHRLIKHMDCSAGVLVHPDAHFDMVRVGMSIYGIHTVADVRRVQARYPHFTLTPALSWTTRVIQIKRVTAGTTIGYNRTYRTRGAARIAVLPVGYWDGYDRALSNRGVVYASARRLPVRGRVCMNLTMVEATKAPGLHEGAMVELIGPHVTASELARLCGTIPYEVLTRLNPLIPRRVTA